MEKQPEKPEKGGAALLALGCTLPVGIALMLAAGPADDQQQVVRMYACLAAALLLAMAAGRLWNAALQKNDALQQSLRRTLPMTGVAAAALFIALICIWRLGLWPQTGIGRNAAHLVLLFMLLAAVYKGGFLRQKISRTAALVLGGGLCLQSVLYVYTPNLVNCDWFVMHHYTAVTQSIYNVAFNTPYTVRSSGTYGHYAIFFWPFLKLFGHTPQVIGVLLSVCNALAMLLVFAAMLKLTRSAGLLFLAVGAMAGVLTPIQTYAALWPLRILWPALILVYLLYGPEPENGHSNGIYLAVGYLLCGLAITWNTDSGLVATVAYTISIWLTGWQQERPFSRRMCRTYALTGMGCVLAVGLMLGIINLYNLLCGGAFLLRGCFFPLIGGEGFAQWLQTNLLETGISWLFPCCVFLAAVALGMFGTSLCRIGGGDQNRQAAFCGIMGLGQSYYFFNRAVSGWSSVCPYLFLCLLSMAAWAVERPAKAERQSICPAARYAAGVCAQLWLCLYAATFLFGFPTLWADRLDTNRNSMASMEELAAEMQEKIPADTYAFGYLTQELYACLGWDPGYHQRDVSDLFFDMPSGQTELADLKTQDAFLVYADVADRFKDDRELLPEDVITKTATGEPVFYYFTRRVAPPDGCDFAANDPQSLPVLRTRWQGLDYDEAQERYWLSPENTLVMNARALKENGLEMEIQAPRYRLTDNGRDSARITVLVEGKPVTQLELTREDETRDKVYRLTAAPEELPDVPADGMYDITITFEAQKPLTWSGRIYSLAYFGTARHGKAVTAAETYEFG